MLGFAGSLAVELVQALFLDARSAQAIDVVANTSGAMAGALLGDLVRRRRRRES
jgi:glycopeptide antibiotics resistance protein